ncbi:hypothetical protein EV421DRAFT_1106435 [Armillaria borealis]|uniref:Uncharacterized protein n=1 Tax=Armillaria borealis TaxID=47425 RepID=A0AA39MKI1_9AGAR|nr:hypothetical protein EV421DRAFT_1106435 [Armillaria borealis]
MQRFTLAVQILYMHYFLFIWAWNDLKAFLTRIAESDASPVSDVLDAREFLQAFRYSFFGKEESLELLQMRISASPAYGTKGEPGFLQSIGGAASFGRRKIA